MMFKEIISEVSFNVDDMTGEEMGFFLEYVMEIGALDAWATPVFMKKQRPAYMITVTCRKEVASEVCDAIFKHTSTFGIRMSIKDRIVLERQLVYFESSFGTVRIKCAGSKKHIEYEDLAKLARKFDTSIISIKEKIMQEIDF